MIREDPDDIGYWVGADPRDTFRERFGRPFHGGYPGTVPGESPTIAACEALVPEWPSITEAAMLSHQGLHRDAERSRERGGYADL